MDNYLNTDTSNSSGSARVARILAWLKAHGYRVHAISPASSDASFRSYWRIECNPGTMIVMDAPPENEDCRPFIRIDESLHAIGLNVPRIYRQDLEQGLLLLGDLGTRQYLDELNEHNADRLYGDAIAALLAMQISGPGADDLPPYDHALLMYEMNLFRDWLLLRHLGISLSDEQEEMLLQVFEELARHALAQPKVCVHRDYHSRNLMVTETNNPGILDFQDAVFGPVTYDLVSLLRDCYIAWPQDRVEDWALDYHQQAMQSGVLDRARHADPEQFLGWFDLMGVQRHLKASGIFARLNHRDGKPGYLQDIPRTLAYIVEVSGRHEVLSGLHDFVVGQVMPEFKDTIP